MRGNGGDRDRESRGDLCTYPAVRPVKDVLQEQGLAVAQVQGMTRRLPLDGRVTWRTDPSILAAGTVVEPPAMTTTSAAACDMVGFRT
eukprot:453480-Hanusia_phi.AAC.1